VSSRFLRIAILCGTLVTLAAMIGGTVFLLDRLRDHDEGTAREAVFRLTKVAEGVVNRELLQVDAALAGLQTVFESLPNPADPTVANRLLRQMNSQNLGFRNILLLQRDGTPWAAALPAPLGNRPLIEETQLGRTSGTPSVVISGPSRNPVHGDWSLFFLREVQLPGLGPMIAVAEIPTALLVDLLLPISDPASLWIMLETNAGRLLTIAPNDEARLGQTLDPPAARLLSLDGQPRQISSRFTGRPIIAAARPSIYREILVVTGYRESSFLATFHAERRNLLLGATGAGLLTLALGIALYAGLRERARLEEERAAARSLLVRAIDSMPDGFVMWDKDDRLVVCNDRYRELYAISAPFIRPGVTFAELVRTGAKLGQYPQAGTDIEAFVQETVAWHRGNRLPLERLLPDGTWLLVTERHLPGGGIVGIRTDITALKRTNNELTKARDTAAAATAAKSRFLARMSHELRTPLNAVMGLAQLLSGDQSLAGEQRDRARLLEQAGRHAVEVANNVLDLAQVEAGHFELHNAAISLSPLLEECAALFDTAAKAKQIVLLLQLPPNLPAQVQADRTRLRQLLLNLLSNAVKFTPPEGRVALRAQVLTPRASGEALLRFEVRDTGPGIPASMRRAIFEDFVQLGAQGEGGAGLGLAITAEIVHQMRGRIGCDANDDVSPAGGAVFWVEIPMPLSSDAMIGAGALPSSEPRRGLNILVADDVPTNLAVARALLESGGHAVTVAADGSQALEEVERAAVERRPYDVVLMDVMMPGMDGLEATRRIRALPGEAGKTPILAVTASAFAEDIAACRAAGMDGHLAKPIERDTLLAVVGRLAGDAPTSKAAPPPASGIALPPALVVPGLDAAAAASLAAAFIAEIRAAGTALSAAADAAGMIAAAHRLAGAAATLSLSPLADAARGFQRSAREMTETDRAERRAALLSLTDATLRAQGPDARATQAEAG